MSKVNQVCSAQSRTSRRTSAQPLHVAEIADALLRIQTVQDLAGLGKTSLYARVRTGELKAVHLGKRCTRFRASEVQRFLQALGKGVA
ncbi:MAG: helix-turn-helix domain-containing protein [Burkholderiales bacterium]|nr:helix-turn-helix domain-containing protein [Burkholderiales bacterium]